jgi:uncharacterized membrane protein
MPHTFRLPPAPRALSVAASLWFVAATLGQWAFVWFIVAFFTPPLVSGDMTALNAKPHITGYVPGDGIGNTQLLMHVYLGAAAVFAGVLQLVPALRRRWPALHRWNGRLFLTATLVATLSGFYLTLIRGSQLNLPSTVSIASNGVLILAFAALAWRSALHRDFAQHRRHALRAYLLVNGVWFLRIGMMLAGLGLSAFGYEMSYDSPVFIGISFLSWIAPLAFLQLYLHAEDSPHSRVQYAVAALFAFLSLLTIAGGAAAAVFMWWPRL